MSHSVSHNGRLRRLLSVFTFSPTQTQTSEMIHVRTMFVLESCTKDICCFAQVFVSLNLCNGVQSISYTEYTEKEVDIAQH